MGYVLLLRGINVGGKNKVSMSELKEQLLKTGFENVSSYINSGNLFFSSLENHEICSSKIRDLLETNYDFSIPFSLITKEEYLEEKVDYQIGGRKTWQEKMYCSFHIILINQISLTL